MSKYGPLQHRLTTAGPAAVRMSFQEIAELVGGLPASASAHRAWWANERRAATSHVQALAWLDAGRTVEEVALGQWVRFSAR